MEPANEHHPSFQSAKVLRKPEPGFGNSPFPIDEIGEVLVHLIDPLGLGICYFFDAHHHNIAGFSPKTYRVNFWWSACIFPYDLLRS